MDGGRPGGPADAIVGVVPATVVQPGTLQECAELVAACARDGKRMAFVGGGTELGIGAAPQGLDVVLRTGALGRVVEHAPLDQIVTVECGVRLVELQARLGGHGQMLALDPPWGDRATIGGLVATAAFGPRRARYGSVRDLIIGVSFLRADGVRARGGGKVVKNVAGFDLPKLLTGSLGTLGMIATATFRLHPRPEHSASVIFPDLAAGDLPRLLAAVRDAQLEPDAVVVLPGGPRSRLGVRFEGFDAAVRAQCQRLRDQGARLGLRVEATAIDGSAAESFWAAHEAARAAPAELRAKVAVLPADPSRAEVFARLGGSLRAARAVFYPTLGLGFVAGDVDDPPAVAAAVEGARRLVAARGGTVVLHEAPASVRARLDVWGASPALASALPLMRSIKQRLDPDRRLAPGRFLAGI